MVLLFYDTFTFDHNVSVLKQWKIKNHIHCRVTKSYLTNVEIRGDFITGKKQIFIKGLQIIKIQKIHVEKYI